MVKSQGLSKVKFGLWVMIMCQCGFINFNKRTTVVWDVDSGCACVWGAYTDALHLSLNFL